MTLAAVLPITGFVPPWADRALSDEARDLRRLLTEASEFPGSVAVGEPKRAAQETLIAVCTAAQVDDWDAAGSRRVEPSTYEYASQFLRLLPSTTFPPDISVDTDGEILIEWDRGPRQVFSVSIGRDGTLTFAGLFGHTKYHGTEPPCEALPSVISDYLARLPPPPGP